MKATHKLINDSALAKEIGMKPGVIGNRLKKVNAIPFTDEELEKIKDAFEDLFCYIFEVDEVEIVNNKIIGSNL